MGFIYKIVNKINGMIYIGQTIKSVEERWRNHKQSASNCHYLKNAFKKYGIDHFDFKIICICFDEELDKFEIQYIKSLNTLVPNGYNIRAGGNGGLHNEETKKKISNTLKNRTDIIRINHQLGKPHTEETKKKISNALKNRTDIIRTPQTHWNNKHHTEESKKKMSLSKCKEIIQYDLNNIELNRFIGSKEASKNVNIHESRIRKCCGGKSNTAGGFKWKYALIIE